MKKKVKMVLTESIRISKDTKLLLESLKIIPNETFDNVINRLNKRVK